MGVTLRGAVALTIGPGLFPGDRGGQQNQVRVHPARPDRRVWPNVCRGRLPIPREGHVLTSWPASRGTTRLTCGKSPAPTSQKDRTPSDRRVRRSWKVAPALACGCTIVMKPSEITPLTALVSQHLHLPRAAALLHKVAGVAMQSRAVHTYFYAPDSATDSVGAAHVHARRGRGRAPCCALFGFLGGWAFGRGRKGHIAACGRCSLPL